MLRTLQVMVVSEPAVTGWVVSGEEMAKMPAVGLYPSVFWAQVSADTKPR